MDHGAERRIINTVNRNVEIQMATILDRLAKLEDENKKLRETNTRLGKTTAQV